MKKKNNTFLINCPISLLTEEEEQEAQAALNIDGMVTWVKFVLTDDQPNGNKQRIPREEFSNLTKTGVLMPIKMERGAIGDHPKSEPLGVIAQLQEEENQINGIGALWYRERPEDVASIKEMILNADYPQISWEVAYSETKDNEEFSSQDLIGTKLRAATIVGVPAYEGRTPMYSAASKNNKEDGSVDELEELKGKYSELETKYNQAVADLAVKDETISTMTTELDGLKEFKSEVERKQAEEEKFAEIKKRFADAGIEKDDEYFSSKREIFLGMDESALEFLIQELVAFSSANEENLDGSESSKKEKKEIPPLTGGEGLIKDPKELGKALREDRLKTK